MLTKIIRFAIAQRWLMLALTGVLIAIGAWSFSRLPIDATPDITNVQVQSIRRRRDIRRWNPSSG